MGAYLSQPITDKEVEEGKIHDWLIFGAAAMQVRWMLKCYIVLLNI
jgi:hypothetical protein